MEVLSIGEWFWHIISTHCDPLCDSGDIMYSLWDSGDITYSLCDSGGIKYSLCDSGGI